MCMHFKLLLIHKKDVTEDAICKPGLNIVSLPDKGRRVPRQKKQHEQRQKV
jgi:hypothetical protein